MKIKICGVTREEDACLAQELGADYIGFNFSTRSPRQITLKQAHTISSELSTAKTVGIFIEQDAKTIQHFIDELNLAMVQVYHPTMPTLKNTKTIFPLRVQSAEDLIGFEHQQSDFILCDSYHKDSLGGSGIRFDWSILPKDKSALFIAGGINPDNIAKVAKLKPYAIDVCSGVETSPGIKDKQKLTQLFKEIRTC